MEVELIIILWMGDNITRFYYTMKLDLSVYYIFAQSFDEIVVLL